MQHMYAKGCRMPAEGVLSTIIGVSLSGSSRGVRTVLLDVRVVQLLYIG
jgi:hypothetical protein